MEFNIDNGRLISIKGNDSCIIIPDGVTTIDGITFDRGVKQIILPDSVKFIDNVKFPYGAKVNMPNGYLQQKSKLPAGTTLELAKGIWLKYVTNVDLVSLYFYQSGKYLKEWCKLRLKAYPEKTTKSFISFLKENKKVSYYNQAAEFIYDNKGMITQESIDLFYELISSSKASGLELIEKIATVSKCRQGSERDTVSAFQAIEDYCRKNYTEYYLDKILSEITNNTVNDGAFHNVLYRGSDEKASPFVAKCAIVPYVELMYEEFKYERKHKYDYKEAFLKPKYIKTADTIAENFDKESFLAALDNFYNVDSGYRQPLALVPLCRFGSGKQIGNIVSCLEKWGDEYNYGSEGRDAIVALRGALMLSDTREAQLYIDKSKALHYYAKLHKTDEDVIRDNAIADFGLDTAGKKSFEIGNDTIDLMVDKDFKVKLYSNKTKKFVKTMPKKDVDPTKYASASEEIADIKKNLKKVIEDQRDLLFEYFLSGKTRDAKSWESSYLNNPVLHRLAELVVWNQNEKTFTINSNGAIDCYGDKYEIDKQIGIGVAYPAELNRDEVRAWQDYFINNKLKQLFEQIWEPVVDFSAVKEDRYNGCLISLFDLYNRNSEGIKVQFSDSDDLIYVYLRDCDVKVEPRNWNHSNRLDNQIMVKVIKVKSETRIANHVIVYLDKVTVHDKVRQDETKLLTETLSEFTIAQITSLIDLAAENNSSKALSVLMDHKNKVYPEYNSEDSFVLML